MCIRDRESDLEFMQRITSEQGLRLAVKSDRVVVYAGQTADQLEPIAIKRAGEAEPGEGLDFQSFRAKGTTEASIPNAWSATRKRRIPRR